LGLGLATCGLGLNDFRIRELGFGLRGRGLGLRLATMGLDYISAIDWITPPWAGLENVIRGVM